MPSVSPSNVSWRRRQTLRSKETRTVCNDPLEPAQQRHQVHAPGGVGQRARSARDSNIEVCVSDNGEGVPTDFLPFVFDRFRQADASSTRKHGGLGLGLSIVKQLVELHGGAVSVQSAGAGKGSTFLLRLPLATQPVTGTLPALASEKPVRKPSDRTTDSTPISGMRVLWSTTSQTHATCSSSCSSTARPR